jgi:hypothetical protein
MIMSHLRFFFHNVYLLSHFAYHITMYVKFNFVDYTLHVVLGCPRSTLTYCISHGLLSIKLMTLPDINLVAYCITLSSGLIA